MKYVWKNATAVLGVFAIAGVVAAAAPGEAEAASKTQSLNVYVDGKKTQLQAKSIEGKAYLSADAVSALGVKVSTEENGAYIMEAAKQTVRLAKKDAVLLNDQIQFPASSVAESLGARWIDDRLSKSLFVFQPSSATSVTPINTVPASSVTVPAKPSEGDSVSLADAVPTLTNLKLEGDTFTLSTTGTVKPNIFELKNPGRVVIDLPGTTLERLTDGKAEGSLQVDPEHPYLTGVRYALFNVEPQTVRIVLDLKRAASYRFELSADGATASVRFEEKRIRVMIDAGHGGHDPGAVSVSGKFEKDLTLAIAMKTAALLAKEPALEPVLIRSGDVYSSPAERAESANRSGVDLYISIHANTAPSPAVKGTETYYWSEISETLAETIHANIVQALGSADRQVKKNSFLVVKDTTMPSVLLELGFLTNAEDEAKLHDETVQDRIAQAIFDAIKQFNQIPEQ